MKLAHQPTLYESLEALPEGLVGEILNGRLYTQSRPSKRHAYVASRIDRSIGRGYGDGVDGPGGWWIFAEPEIHFVRNIEVAVPDLAGWRRERMPSLPLPEDHRFEVVPDWICEILSPSTASKDRQDKMLLYAHYEVQYAWLIDPVQRILEVYRLGAGTWIKVGHFTDDEQVTAPPFEAMSLDLRAFWVSGGRPVVV